MVSDWYPLLFIGVLILYGSLLVGVIFWLVARANAEEVGVEIGPETKVHRAGQMSGDQQYCADCGVAICGPLSPYLPRQNLRGLCGEWVYAPGTRVALDPARGAHWPASGADLAVLEVCEAAR